MKSRLRIPPGATRLINITYGTMRALIIPHKRVYEDKSVKFGLSKMYHFNVRAKENGELLTKAYKLL